MVIFNNEVMVNGVVEHLQDLRIVQEASSRWIDNISRDSRVADNIATTIIAAPCQVPVMVAGREDRGVPDHVVEGYVEGNLLFS